MTAPSSGPQSATIRGDRPRLLLISCHFPPVGGAGVQRPAKFVKYLGQFGWDVSVLTVANPSVPVFDDSLLKDVPAEVHVEKAPTWEPGYHLKKNVSANTESQGQGLLARWKQWPRRLVRRLVQTALQPDAQVLWYWPALRAAKQLLRRVRHDALLVTAPPYSAFLLGAKLKQVFQLPLLLDYRDEWDLSSRYLENSQRDWFSQLVQERMQGRVLLAADAVIATTQASRLALERRLRGLNSAAAAHCIYNGFDPDDFPALPAISRPAAAPLRIVYTGTLWNLTTVEPLVRAVELLACRSPELPGLIEFLFVGRKTADQSALLERIAAAGCRMVQEDYCPHAQALEQMRSADALCLLLSDVPGAERVVPAKLFEYLAQRKPVLSVLPRGEAAGIIEQFFPESTFQPGETQALADWLGEQAGGAATGLTEVRADQIQQYTRAAETRQLAELLDQLTGRNSGVLGPLRSPAPAEVSP